MKKFLLKIVITILCGIIFAIPSYANSEYNNVEAKVVKDLGIKEVKKDDGTTQIVQGVTIRILEGDYKQEEHDVEYVLKEDIDNSNNSKDKLMENNKILANIQEENGEITSINIQEIVRQNNIIFMILIFLILVLIVARKKGIKLILISIFTVLSIYYIFVCSISKGWNLLLMSFITALCINIFVSMILNGISKKTDIIVLCSMLGVIISGIIAFIYFKFMQLSGEILNVSIFNISLSIKELLYSGVILSSCGICLYISSAISNYLEGLKEEDKNINWKQLFKLGIEKGTNLITNIIYIPILLYLCSAITLLIIYISNSIYSPNISIIIAYLVNISIGGIITIPITSFLYSFLNRNKIFYKVKSDNIIEGKRSLKL